MKFHKIECEGPLLLENLGSNPSALSGRIFMHTTYDIIYGYTGGAWKPQGFPSGTKMIFNQASAPVGWTKESGWAQDTALIVGNNSGSGGSDSPKSWTTGISVNDHASHTHNDTFTVDNDTHNHGLSGSVSSTDLGSHDHNIDSTALGTHNHSDTFSVADHTLTIAEMPRHNHSMLAEGGTQPLTHCATRTWGALLSPTLIDFSGSDDPHNHGLSGSVSNEDLGSHTHNADNEDLGSHTHGDNFSVNSDTHNHGLSGSVSSNTLDSHSITQSTFEPVYQKVIAGTKD